MHLLDLDFGAGSFELLLGFFGFLFLDAFLDLGTALFDESLGFGEAEACDESAHFLNDRNLVAATINEDDVKFGLFDCRRSSRTGGGGASVNRQTW